MPLRIKKLTARKITTLGLFVSVGLVLHYAESFVPGMGVLPGVRIGLANIVTLLAFFHYGAGFSLTVGLLRSLLGSLLGGTITAFLYSGAGTIGAVLVMLVSRRFFSGSVSLIGWSMLGAFAFNLAQVTVAALVLENAYMFMYLPPMAIFSAVSGLCTGLLATRISPKNERQSF